MAISRAKKEQQITVVAQNFEKSVASIVAEYRGISAPDLAALRGELKKHDSEFKVVKNRVVKKAIEQTATSQSALSDKLTGPVGVTYIYGDVAAGAKALLNFAKDHEEIKVTGGVMDGKALSVGDLKALSELPSKEVLLSQIVGSLVAPHRGLLHVLNGVSSKLVRAVSAIKDTKA